MSLHAPVPSALQVKDKLPDAAKGDVQVNVHVDPGAVGEPEQVEVPPVGAANVAQSVKIGNWCRLYWIQLICSVNK